jgi:hypothetical protein
LTDAAVLLLGRRLLGPDFDHVSALQDLVWERFLARNRRWSRLRDGNDRLPEAFAQRLGPCLHYGAERRGLAQDSKAVRLGIAHQGRWHGWSRPRRPRHSVRYCATCSWTTRFRGARRAAVAQRVTSRRRTSTCNQGRFWRHAV